MCIRDRFPLTVREDENTIRGVCDKWKLRGDGESKPVENGQRVGRGWGAKMIQDPALLYPLQELPFEDMMIPVPYETKKYLIRKYHSMEVPKKFQKYMDGTEEEQANWRRNWKWSHKYSATRPPTHPRGLEWEK